MAEAIQTAVQHATPTSNLHAIIAALGPVLQNTVVTPLRLFFVVGVPWITVYTYSISKWLFVWGIWLAQKLLSPFLFPMELFVKRPATTVLHALYQIRHILYFFGVSIVLGLLLGLFSSTIIRWTTGSKARNLPVQQKALQRRRKSSTSSRRPSLYNDITPAPSKSNTSGLPPPAAVQSENARRSIPNPLQAPQYVHKKLPLSVVVDEFDSDEEAAEDGAVLQSPRSTTSGPTLLSARRPSGLSERMQSHLSERRGSNASERRGRNTPNTNRRQDSLSSPAALDTVGTSSGRDADRFQRAMSALAQKRKSQNR